MYLYDADGNLYGLKYDNTDYLYVRNGQNDIIRIADTNGWMAVEYSYDAWGNQTSIAGSMASTLAYKGL